MLMTNGPDGALHIPRLTVVSLQCDVEMPRKGTLMSREHGDFSLGKMLECETNVGF